MKKNILLIALVGMFLAIIGLTGCQPDYETDFEVKTLVVPDKSLSPVYFNIEGGESVAHVNTNVPIDMWTAKSNADWLKVEKQADKVLISAGSNDIYTSRTARVTIEYGHQSYDIVVAQLGKESTILVDGKREGVIRHVTSTQEKLNVDVLTNLRLDNIIVPDTVSWVSLAPQFDTRSAEGALETVTFDLVANTDTVIRYCEIILQSSDNYDYITTFTIIQDERGYIVQADDSVKTYNILATGEEIEIPFNVNGPVGDSYTFEVEESAKDWIIPATTIQTRALRPVSEKFSVLPNIVEEPRVGHITFTSTDESENSSFTVVINQEKFIPVPPENVVNPTTTPGEGFITLNWELPETLNYTKLEVSYFDQVFKEQVVKTVDNNRLTQLKIENTYKVAGEYEFTITSYGPTGMVTETPVTVTGVSDAMPDFFKVDLRANMLKTNAQEPHEGPIANLVDGNLNTYFHTIWSGTVNALHYFEIHLDEAIQEFDYNFVTRHNGNGGGDVTRMKLEVSSDGKTWTEVAVHSYPLPQYLSSQIDGKPVSASNPFTILRCTPLARRSADPINNSWFNMAEFRLFEKNLYSELWAGAQL